MKTFKLAPGLLLFLLTATSLAADPGDLDPTFSADGKVYNVPVNFMPAEDVAVQTDGKLVLAGSTLGPDNTQDFAVVRLNANGSPDTTFGTAGLVAIPFDTNFNEMAVAIAVQADGKIVVAGSVALGTAGWDFGIVRLNSNGTIDTTYGGGRVKINIGGDDFAYDLILQTDGKAVITGTARPSPNTDIALVRLTTSGVPDMTLNGTGIIFVGIGEGNNDAGTSLALQPDGKILIGGYSREASRGYFLVMRITTGGLPDSTFGFLGFRLTSIGTQFDQANSVAIQSDGKIMLGGTSNSGSADEFAFARYTSDGNLDTTFSVDGKLTIDVVPGTADVLRSVLIQSDGKIIGAGGGGGSHLLVRLDSAGVIDATFGTGGKVIENIAPSNSFGRKAILQADGKIVSVGDGSGPNTFGFTAARFLTAAIPPLDTPFDFDGDDKTDISIFRPAVAEWWINNSSSNSTFAAQFGTSTDKIVPGDYTGDGKADIAIWRPASGEWFILRSEDFSYYSFPFGASGDLPAPGDFDADEKIDAAVFRPSTATWYVLNSTGGTTIQQFGAAGDVPVQADYDGDNRADIAIFRPSNGQWWMQRSTAGTIAFIFGSGPTDRPLPGGDYTGDGRADVAIIRDGVQWFIVRSEEPSYYSFVFGSAGDIPAPGDYDGDGRWDPTMFRPSNGTWYSDRTTAGTLIRQFGVNGDRPVPNAFVP